jgi:hypothetical protein
MRISWLIGFSFMLADLRNLKIFVLKKRPEASEPARKARTAAFTSGDELSGNGSPSSDGNARKVVESLDEFWDRCYDFLFFSLKKSAKIWRFWLKTKLNYAKI